jgi:hypothetical protein
VAETGAARAYWLDQSRPGREELTDEELERWIETFPIVRLRPN